MLLRLCWAKRPRNRPSFASIFTHLENLNVELMDISEDAWKIRKRIWQKDITEENKKLLTQNSGNINKCNGILI